MPLGKLFSFYLVSALRHPVASKMSRLVYVYANCASEDHIHNMGVLIFDIYLSIFPWYVERPQKPDKALIHLQMMFLITRCLRYHM